MQIPCGAHAKIREGINIQQSKKRTGARLCEFTALKESEIPPGHVMQGYVHMLICIPSKYRVSQIVGYIKGKSAIWIARNYYGKRQNYTGLHFRGRCFHVSPVGRDEKVIAKYICNQERMDIQENCQLGLGG